MSIVLAYIIKISLVTLLTLVATIIAIYAEVKPVSVDQFIYASFLGYFGRDIMEMKL